MVNTMKRFLLLVALSLLLAGCGEAVAPVATPTPTPTLANGLCNPSCSTETSPVPAQGVTPSSLATQGAQPVTMESDVHAYDPAHFGVYFVTYQTLGRDETAKFTGVEWDCFPPDPTHSQAFFSVPVFHRDDTLSYDGHALMLTPVVPPPKPFTGILTGTINADGSWPMLEKDSGLHFTFKVAKDTPDSFVKKYQDAPCTPSE